MANFKVRNTTHAEGEYAYRWSLVFFGKAIEVNVSREDLATLRKKSQALVARANGAVTRFKQMGATSARKVKTKPVTKATRKRRTKVQEQPVPATDHADVEPAALH